MTAQQAHDFIDNLRSLPEIEQFNDLQMGPQPLPEVSPELNPEVMPEMIPEIFIP